MEVNRMVVVGLVVESQTVPPALLQDSGDVFFVVRFSIDGPAIELARPSVDFPEYHRNCFLRRRGLLILPEDGVIPRSLRRRDPARRAALAGVFDHDPQAVLAIVVARGS